MFETALAAGSGSVGGEGARGRSPVWGTGLDGEEVDLGLVGDVVAVRTEAIQGLIAMDAKAVIAGPQGTRELDLAGFFTGPGKTVLEAGEFLLKFKVPAPKAGTGAVYKKFAIRGDTDISIVGVACRLIVQKDGTVEDARISLAAVAPKPIRVPEAEKLLIGKKLTPELI